MRYAMAMHERGLLPRVPLLALMVLLPMLPMVLSPAALPAQEANASDSPGPAEMDGDAPSASPGSMTGAGVPDTPRPTLQALVPVLPAGRSELPLALSVPDTADLAAGDLEVYRLGQAGTLARPRSLDLPQRVTAFQPEAWDWLRPRNAAVDIAGLDPYRIWVRADHGSHVVLIAADHLELVHGELLWLDAGEDAMRRHVSAGPLTLRGRGEARMLRGNGELLVEIVRGRFELERDGELLLVLGAGQERRIVLDAGWPAGPRAAALERFRLLREVHAELLLSLVHVQGATPAPVPDGDSLARLWERTVAVLPLYAYAEARRVAWLPAPDVRRREIGEALRILAAFSFAPPPRIGM